MDKNGMMFPIDLEVNKNYAWLMGAKPLTCTYLGRGIKLRFSYRFRLDKSEHELSYADVRNFIGNCDFHQPVNPS